MFIPILRTKLNRPPVSKGHLHRPRLLDWLDRRRQRPLTLVSAPAGYGANNDILGGKKSKFIDTHGMWTQNIDNCYIYVAFG
jgi:hypothetical protein